MATKASCRDTILIRALRRAHALLVADTHGLPMINAVPHQMRGRSILRLAFLSPDIQRDILAGKQPPGLTLSGLLEGDMPLLWSHQRDQIKALGRRV